MINGLNGIPRYVKDFVIEATFRSIEENDIYLYGYVTYDKTKLRGPQIQKTNKYNVQAYGKIPITESELIDMSLHSDKDDKLVDFHMTYLRRFRGKKDSELEKAFNRRITLVNIRSDIGPHKGLPHNDIEIYGINNRLVRKWKVYQEDEITKYESAISSVLMQAEKVNPLIGAQYWLSPTLIFPERVYKLAKIRQQSKILSPLTLLARAININVYEEIQRGSVISEHNFWGIVNTQLDFIKNKEKELGGWLDIEEINYSTRMSVLPFLFFIPENAKYLLSSYHSDGTNLQTGGEPLGIVLEKKNGVNIMRGLNYSEANPATE